MTSSLQEPPQRGSKWFSDGRKREVQQFEHYKESWNQRLNGGEVSPATLGLDEVLGGVAAEDHV